MDTALLLILAAGVGLLLWRSYLPAYMQEKGKNLATKEDVSEITKRVEDVKALYTQQLNALEHQNAMVLEQLRAQHALRLAAIDKRLAVHQEAFILWRRMVREAHSENVQPLVIECQDWWEKNCLYLGAEARDSFNAAYFAASSHRILTQDRSNVDAVKENWRLIMKAGEDIVAGAELPPLGSRESKVTEGGNAA